MTNNLLFASFIIFFLICNSYRSSNVLVKINDKNDDSMKIEGFNPFLPFVSDINRVAEEMMSKLNFI